MRERYAITRKGNCDISRGESVKSDDHTSQYAYNQSTMTHLCNDPPNNEDDRPRKPLPSSHAAPTMKTKLTTKKRRADATPAVSFTSPAPAARGKSFEKLETWLDGVSSSEQADVDDSSGSETRSSLRRSALLSAAIDEMSNMYRALLERVEILEESNQRLQLCRRCHCRPAQESKRSDHPAGGGRTSDHAAAGADSRVSFSLRVDSDSGSDLD